MRTRKGIELPMNTLVAVAIAVIVLLAMVAFFLMGFGPQSTQQVRYSNLMKECELWSAVGCGGNPPDSLKKAYCEWKGGTWDDGTETCSGGITITDDALRDVCGCPEAYE